MGFWTFFPFLALGILVLYQVGVLQAALFSEEEGELLADVLMKDPEKRMMASEQKQETEDFRATVQKRACHFSTCMFGSLADYLSKAAQKNKSMENDILPESMGRHRRDLQS